MRIEGLGDVPVGFAVELPELPIVREEGEELVLAVSLAADLATGKHAGKLKLAVNGDVHEELVIPLSVEVVNAIRLAQDKVFFGMVPASETKARTVRLILPKGVSAEDVAVTCAGGYLSVAVIELEDGESGVRLKLRAVEEPGPFSTEVTLKARGPDGTQAVGKAVCYGIRAE
jgi:hypothetical protein